MSVLKPLKQYEYERQTFVNCVKEYCPNILDLFDGDLSTENFNAYTIDNEHYIVHFESGFILNWYKNLGRTNTCNFCLSLSDLIEVLKQLSFEIDRDINEVVL